MLFFSFIPGKSAFLSFALYKLLTRPDVCRIVLHCLKTGAFLFQRNSLDAVWSVVEVDATKVKLNLSANTIYLVDGVTPVVMEGVPILLVTSPRYSVYREFIKSDSSRFDSAHQTNFLCT
jgi:hypothetical protein